jgi:hypothetical protein
MTERPEDMPPEMAELPEGWKTLPSGTPTPNSVVALHEARDSETRAINDGSRSETVPLPEGWGNGVRRIHARCCRRCSPVAGIALDPTHREHDVPSDAGFHKGDPHRPANKLRATGTGDYSQMMAPEPNDARQDRPSGSA